MARHEVRQIWRRAFDDFAFAWRGLIATDILYKILALGVFAPLLAAMTALFLRLSGNEVRADQDILFFLVSPVGFVGMVVVAACLLGILALESACLMCIARAARRRRFLPVVAALRFSLRRAGRILQVTVGLVVRLLVFAIPLAIAAAVPVYWLLSDHDINFYLANRPPAFLLAAAWAGILFLVLVLILVRRLAAWFLVLPLVLFEDVRPAASFGDSAARTAGQRKLIVVLLITWWAVFTAISFALLALVRGAGLTIAGLVVNKVGLLVAALLSLLFLWFAASLLVNTLSNCFLALLVSDRHDACPRNDRRNPVALDTIASERIGALASRAVLAMFLVAMTAAFIGGWALLRGAAGEAEVMVVAHRGAAGHAPENSLAAIELAIEMGADAIEIDVQEAADGVVVVIHDSDLMKIAGAPVKVWEASHAELAEFDTGSWFDPKFGDQRLPTLGEVLDLVGRRAQLFIELKYYGREKNLEQRVIDEVEARGLAGDVVIISLKYPAVQKMRQLRREWRLGLLTARALGDLTRVDADFLAVNVGMATRRFVRRAHAAGKDVYVWTPNDAATMSRMVSQGVDGLITDFPDVAAAILAERRDLGSAERLLLDLALFMGIRPEPVDIAAETAGAD